MSAAGRALTPPPRWSQANAAWREALQTLVIVARRDRFALAGLIIYLVFFVLAVLAPALAPYPPLELNYLPDGDVAANLAPSLSHLLGTTNIGRDVFSQLLYGSRAALVVGFVAALGVVILGTVVGLFAGYYGGWGDTPLMRGADRAFGTPLRAAPLRLR